MTTLHYEEQHGGCGSDSNRDPRLQPTDHTLGTTCQQITKPYREEIIHGTTQTNVPFQPNTQSTISLEQIEKD